MRVVFLAAGKGERIFSHFKINKPLIKIGDKSLLENLILGAHNKKISKITIVVGYKKKNILTALNKYKKIDFISNNKFNTTDMTHSLMMGLKKYKENILFSYSDIIYENNIFNILKKTESKHIIIPYFKDWKKTWNIRKKSIYEDAETFKFDKNKFLKEIGKKITDKKKVQGQFMGLIYIPKFLRENILKIYQDNFKNKKIQTTQFLQYLLKKKIKIKCMEYKGDWYEIDDYKDYKFFITNNDFKRINRNFKF